MSLQRFCSTSVSASFLNQLWLDPNPTLNAHFLLSYITIQALPFTFDSYTTLIRLPCNNYSI